MFSFKKTKRNNYFLMLYDLTDYCVKSSEFLSKSIRDLNTDNIKEKVEDAHKIEHSADVAQHELITKLSKEFLTPIEREDIVLLAQNIDNVTDRVESVFLHFYMYSVDEVMPVTFEFCDLIYKSCLALKELMDEFQHFRKSDKINDIIIKLNDLESEGDTLYTETVHKLYSEEHDAIHVIKWTNILSHFEKCLDSCETVAGIVKRVIMANS